MVMGNGYGYDRALSKSPIQTKFTTGNTVYRMAGTKIPVNIATFLLFYKCFTILLDTMHDRLLGKLQVIPQSRSMKYNSKIN